MGTEGRSSLSMRMNQCLRALCAIFRYQNQVSMTTPTCPGSSAGSTTCCRTSGAGKKHQTHYSLLRMYPECSNQRVTDWQRSTNQFLLHLHPCHSFVFITEVQARNNVLLIISFCLLALYFITL